jgi:eukaryotic-like serine/threonine-protein kinase
MNVAQDLIGGRYRLLEIIGAGGMGRVWLADDELLRRRVAVKEIGTPAGVTPAQLLDAQLTTMREARAAARLDHAGVVAIYDVVWRPDRSWIVMEHVESRSLEAVIREDGPLPHREVARIGLGVLAALRAAHTAGVLHRDVKPHNVLLATDGRVVLTDFGLAQIKGTKPGTGPLLGSPFYVAPERLQDSDTGEAADLWSLGATLYAAVEGRAPFQRPTPAETLAALLAGPPDPATHPGPLTPIIDDLLVRDPGARLTAAAAQPRLQRVADRAVGIFPMRVSRQRIPAPPGTSALGMSMLLDRTVGPARKRLARSTKIALSVAGVLLVGTAGTALALDLQPRPASVVPVSSAASGPVPPCAAGPVVTGKTQARGYAVPAGWLWHADPTGFDVAVPKGWTRGQDGTAACFRDPGGNREFRVDASARLSGPALDRWRSAEEDALAGGYLPGYQRVSMAALPGQDGAAWEYTWQPDGEPVRRHERRTLLTVADARAYLVEWTAPDQDWTGTEPYLHLVLASLS